VAKVLSPDRQATRRLITPSLRAAILCLGLTLLFALVSSARADIANLLPEGGSGFTTTQTATAHQAMVVTAHPLASKAALDVLKRGGSAADAAIAAQLVLGLVEPQSSGLGGGAFLLHWSAGDKKLTSYDGRETASASVTSEHFLQDGKPMSFMDAVIGGKGVGAPGVVSLLALTHKQHGKLPWKDLFQPAITLAKDGFAISPRLNQSLYWIIGTSTLPGQAVLTTGAKVSSNPSKPVQIVAAMANQIDAGDFRTTYFQTDGTPWPAGHVLKNPAYAATLAAIAEGGEAAFYRGDLARAMVDVVHRAKRPGALSETDLANYHAVERAALCQHYLRYDICGAPPPSSGAFTVLSILGMLQHLPAAADDATFAHNFAEASRLAFADRNTYLADPDFVPQPLSALLAVDYLHQRAALIPTQKASATPARPGNIKLAWQPAKSPELPSTTHLVVTDPQGNVVSMTSSIEMAFGSQLMTQGFLLNNQLTDFSFTPRNGDGSLIANRIEPGKRPRSSMAPLIVFEQGQPLLAIGSPGGSRIIPYVARVLAQHLQYGKPLADSIAAPHVVDMNDQLEVEQRADADALASTLQSMGHQVKRMEQPSGLNAIRWQRSGKDVELFGVADPRREGQAVGF